MAFDYLIFSNLPLHELRDKTNDYLDGLVERGYVSFFKFSVPTEVRKEILEEDGYGADFISSIFANAYKDWITELQEALAVMRDQVLKDSKCIILLNGEYEVP